MFNVSRLAYMSPMQLFTELQQASQQVTLQHRENELRQREHELELHKARLDARLLQAQKDEATMHVWMKLLGAFPR